MAIKEKLFSNATYLSLNWFFITFFSLIFWLILGKTISPDSYGIVALFFQIATILSGISVLGLSSAISKLIPEFLERNRGVEVQGLILFSFKWVLVASLTIAIILTIFSSQLSVFLKLQKEVLWIVSISIVVMVTVGVFDYIYHGFQNMKKLFLTNFCGGLSKIAFTLLFVFLNFDYFGVIVAIFLSYVVVILTRLEKAIFKISKKLVVDKKLILKFSIPAFTVYIFSAILNESQFILLSLMKTAELTGLFAVGMKISSVITVIPLVFLSSLAPIVSGLCADKNSKLKQSYLVKLVFRYILFFVLPTAILLILFSKYAILLFSNPSYLPAANFLIILTAASVFGGLASFLLSNLYTIGNPNKYRDSQIISSLAYLSLSIPLTYYFSATGLSFSYLFSTILLFFLSLFYLRKHLNFIPPLKDVGRILIGCAISAIFLILLKPYINNFLVAIVFAIIAGFIYLASLLKLKFYLKEDLMILDFLSERIPIFGKIFILVRNFLSKYVNRSYKLSGNE